MIKDTAFLAYWRDLDVALAAHGSQPATMGEACSAWRAR